MSEHDLPHGDRFIQRLMGWDDRVPLPRNREGKIVVPAVAGGDPPPELWGFNCAGQLRPPAGRRR